MREIRPNARRRMRDHPSRTMTRTIAFFLFPGFQLGARDLGIVGIDGVVPG